MKVTQMINNSGRPIANHFIIEVNNKRIFQSYKTIVVEVEKGKITLDTNAMAYSNTTRKYLYMFLGMDKKSIEKSIKEGNITLKDLNN
jgi:hypothetical protein